MAAVVDPHEGPHDVAEPLCALAVLALAARADAEECTTVTFNNNCVISIDREVPVSPLPIKVHSAAPLGRLLEAFQARPAGSRRASKRRGLVRRT